MPEVTYKGADFPRLRQRQIRKALDTLGQDEGASALLPRLPYAVPYTTPSYAHLLWNEWARVTEAVIDHAIEAEGALLYVWLPELPLFVASLKADKRAPSENLIAAMGARVPYAGQAMRGYRDMVTAIQIGAFGERTTAKGTRVFDPVSARAFWEAIGHISLAAEAGKAQVTSAELWDAWLEGASDGLRNVANATGYAACMAACAAGKAAREAGNVAGQVLKGLGPLGIVVIAGGIYVGAKVL